MEGFPVSNRPDWLIDLDRKAFESVCTQSIMSNAKSPLTLHIRIALSGKSVGLMQFMANREAVRG